MAHMNVLLLESTRFAAVFREMGWQVMYLGPHPVPKALAGVGMGGQRTSMCYHRELMTILQARAFEPDLVLWCDHGYLPTVLGFEALPCPVIGVTIDDYCHPWHVPFSAAFDMVLVAQKDYVGLFEQEQLPRQARWSPLFCDASKDSDPGLERDIPVSFVGTLQPNNIPERLSFLQAFQENAPLVMEQGDYRPIFQRSQIVLNQSAIGELNFRVFEAAACGAPVLTEATPNGLEDILTPGVSMLPPYPKGNAAAAAALARFWLKKPEALRRIAETAKEIVLQEHTLQVRARGIAKAAGEMAQSGFPAWRQAQARRVRSGLATACTFIAAELEQPEFAKMRQTYQNIGDGYAALWERL